MNKGLLFVMFLFLQAVVIGQIKVEKIDKPGLEKVIKERNGKVLLLNIWATWCAPCREEFPDLVKLAADFRDKKVELIGISIDYPEEVKQKIIPFLKKQKTNFNNYVASFKNDEELINMINKDWNGAIPATIIYNTEGKMDYFIEGKRTYMEFAESIKSRLR